MRWYGPRHQLGRGKALPAFDASLCCSPAFGAPQFPMELQVKNTQRKRMVGIKGAAASYTLPVGINKQKANHI